MLDTGEFDTTLLFDGSRLDRGAFEIAPFGIVSVNTGALEPEPFAIEAFDTGGCDGARFGIIPLGTVSLDLSSSVMGPLVVTFLVATGPFGGATTFGATTFGATACDSKLFPPALIVVIPACTKPLDV